MPRNEREPLVILVATATDRKVEKRYLRELPAERRAIQDALQAAEQRGLCKFEPLADATLHEIFDAFQRYRNRVAIFHFGGHANSYQLLLDSAEGTPAAAGGRGLAEFLGKQQSLQLVFLNGCSTYGHVEALHRAGVSAVVVTSRAVMDAVACGFAARFYRALGTGASVEKAFNEAAAEARDRANDNSQNIKRDLDSEESGSDISRESWPWDLKVAPGAEASLEWSLTEAAGDPTFGIPPVPKGDLPEQAEGPYLGLRRFERKHAELFFGRGSDIRALYEWLKAGDEPILLLHGQSGVGKSSLLDAGFLPRLEADYEFRPRRRDSQEGLLWTLATALGAEKSDDLLRVWTDTEARLEKPQLVVLDQVEEAFTQPIRALPTELEDFSAALVAIFHDRARRPRGKLILGLRKDYCPEVKARFKTAKLYHTDHFLQPLSRAGIVEAIVGPTREERLRKRFRLAIAPPAEGERPLAEAIADDLRKDPDSPIAPTLQVLLAKMWEAVKDKAERKFDRTLYEELAKPGEGGLLDTFLGEQLAELARWRPDLGGRASSWTSWCTTLPRSGRRKRGRGTSSVQTTLTTRPCCRSWLNGASGGACWPRRRAGRRRKRRKSSGPPGSRTTRSRPWCADALRPPTRRGSGLTGSWRAGRGTGRATAPAARWTRRTSAPWNGARRACGVRTRPSSGCLRRAAGWAASTLASRRIRILRYARSS